jgi:hypothetical protein
MECKNTDYICMIFGDYKSTRCYSPEDQHRHTFIQYDFNSKFLHIILSSIVIKNDLIP